MQSALDVCFRAAFNMQTIFALNRRMRIRYENKILYEIQKFVNMYMIHKHNSFKLDLKLNQNGTF